MIFVKFPTLSLSWKAATLLLCAYCCLSSSGCGQQGQSSPETDSATAQRHALTDPRVLENAFHARQSNLQVTQQGTIVKVLADDEEGARHQRCIVELPSRQRLLIAHNIDIAPRIPGLMKGETLTFHGEYEWNRKGGVIHWTHHDPEGRHQNGWIVYQGKTYE
jgi:hypothetical protein